MGKHVRVVDDEEDVEILWNDLRRLLTGLAAVLYKLEICSVLHMEKEEKFDKKYGLVIESKWGRKQLGSDYA